MSSLSVAVGLWNLDFRARILFRPKCRTELRTMQSRITYYVSALTQTLMNNLNTIYIYIYMNTNSVSMSGRKPLRLLGNQKEEMS